MWSPRRVKPFQRGSALWPHYALTKTEDGRVISDITNPRMHADVLVPIQWSEERVSIPETLRSKLLSYVKLGATVKSFFIGLLIVGSLFLIRGIFLYIASRRHQTPLQA